MAHVNWESQFKSVGRTIQKVPSKPCRCPCCETHRWLCVNLFGRSARQGKNPAYLECFASSWSKSGEVGPRQGNSRVERGSWRKGVLRDCTRQVFGREKFFLQGIPVTAWEKLQWCSERQLSDLAGNALCTANALPVQLMAAIVVCTCLSWQTRSEVKEPWSPRMNPSPTQSLAGSVCGLEKESM